MKKMILSMSVTVLLFITAFNVSGKMNSVVDRSGREITVEKPFKRIISLYGAHTENLFALGLDMEIVGVSGNETYTSGATKKPAFSYHDDAEKFIAARPDLILIRPMIARGYGNLVLKLQRARITVVSLQPTTVDEMYLYWKKLGILTGKEKQAEEMIERFQLGLSRMNAFLEHIPPTERKRVYFESIHSKMKTFSPSSITIFALKAAGGINIADDAKSVRGTNIAEYGKERILSHAHETDVYLAQRGPMNHITVQQIVTEGGFKAIKAVSDGNIHIIDERIVSRPTLRLLNGICEIGRALYPDVFIDCN